MTTGDRCVSMRFWLISLGALVTTHLRVRDLYHPITVGVHSTTVSVPVLCQKHFETVSLSRTRHFETRLCTRSWSSRSAHPEKGGGDHTQGVVYRHDRHKQANRWCGEHLLCQCERTQVPFLQVTALYDPPPLYRAVWLCLIPVCACAVCLLLCLLALWLLVYGCTSALITTQDVWWTFEIFTPHPYVKIAHQSWLIKVGSTNLTYQSWPNKVGSTKLAQQSWLNKAGSTKLAHQSWLNKAGSTKLAQQSWLTNA